jgi:hypothetical protein
VTENYLWKGEMMDFSDAKEWREFSLIPGNTIDPIGYNLKFIRREKKISQRKLGEELGPISRFRSTRTERTEFPL